MALIENFPSEYQPRPSQIKLINEIEKAFEDYDFVICSAPTGTGKSFLAKTLANSGKDLDPDFVDDITSYRAYSPSNTETYPHHRGTAVLTITKALQNQYKELFDDAEELKGKSNYQCEVDPNVDVEIGPCIYLPKIKQECWATNTCPYYKQRNEALAAEFSVYNYSMFLALPHDLKKKEFLVCDEASELEDQIVKHFSLNFTKKTLQYMGVSSTLPNATNYNKFHEWLVTLHADLNDRVYELRQKISSKDKTDKDVSKYKVASRFKDKLDLILNSWSDCEYVVDKNDDTISIVPLYIDTLSSEVFRYGDKILLMSATIIDPAEFAKSLGIEKYKFIEAPSPFKAEKSPIHVSSKYKLNYQNLQTNLPKVCDLIQEICNHHKNDKGAIHTHTSYITSFLKERLKGDRFLYRFEDINNEKLIEDHINSKDDPTVLVSPSITHGVDLKDDLARFQIIVKLPYLPLGDKRIKKLFDTNSNWYTNKMLSSLVQAAGRGVRTPEDWCVTYILDGGTASVLGRSKNKLPKFFLDRLQ